MLVAGPVVQVRQTALEPEVSVCLRPDQRFQVVPTLVLPERLGLHLSVLLGFQTAWPFGLDRRQIEDRLLESEPSGPEGYVHAQSWLMSDEHRHKYPDERPLGLHRVVLVVLHG